MTKLKWMFRGSSIVAIVMAVFPSTQSERESNRNVSRALYTADLYGRTRVTNMPLMMTITVAIGKKSKLSVHITDDQTNIRAMW